MKQIKNIAVVTGSRAEYGILKPLLEELEEAKNVHLSVYVTGMHLLKKYGNTVDVIKKDGFHITKTIPMYAGKESKKEYVGTGLGKGIVSFTKAFQKRRPDMLLVFGDRFESLAVTLAAATLHIPIGHIHGGDKTDSGHIDESTRHAITRYSHIHFAPTKKAANRLLKMGEEQTRVHMVGALSIDALLRTPHISKKELFSQLQLQSTQETVVCLFNPLPVESQKMGAQAKELCTTIQKLKKQTVIIYPNNDEGSDDIITEIEKLRKLPYVSIHKNLSSEVYINLLRYADVLVGNSSSGIIEAPAFQLPVVNVGSRNVGREHAQNILFVEPKTAPIQKALEKALYDRKFINKVQKVENPYGAGGATKAIMNVIKKVDLNNQLILKKVTY